MTADYRQLNGIALAYLGDAVYEVYIREHLLAKGMAKPNRLQHVATNYVSAKAQAALIEKMQTEELLTEEEWAYFKRGRNANSYTYRMSTGFEALIGYLRLAGQEDRLQTIIQWCIAHVEKGDLIRAK